MRKEKLQDLKLLQMSPPQKRKREPSNGDHFCIPDTEPRYGVAQESSQSRKTSQTTSYYSSSSSASPVGSNSVRSLVRMVEEQLEEGELGSTLCGGSEALATQYCDTFVSLFGDEGMKGFFYLFLYFCSLVVSCSSIFSVYTRCC